MSVIVCVCKPSQWASHARLQTHTELFGVQVLQQGSIATLVPATKHTHTHTHTHTHFLYKLTSKQQHNTAHHHPLPLSRQHTYNMSDTQPQQATCDTHTYSTPQTVHYHSPMQSVPELSTLRTQRHSSPAYQSLMRTSRRPPLASGIPSPAAGQV